MPGDQVRLRGAQATLLMTLYLHDLDARVANPILGDGFATRTLGRIDYDTSTLRRLASDTATICARARLLDEWTTAFLVEHPGAQVLHLGCGLDSRPLRLDRPAGSRWIDLDVPEVIKLRRRLLDLRDDVECIGASVTDPQWWDRIEPGRPTVVVAEGLFMYLDPDGVHALLDRIAGHGAPGRLLFDTVAPWTVWVSGRTREFQAVGARFGWGYRVGDLDRHPRLTRRESRRVTEVAARLLPTSPRRLLYQLCDRVPGLRTAMLVHRVDYPAR